MNVSAPIIIFCIDSLHSRGGQSYFDQVFFCNMFSLIYIYIYICLLFLIKKNNFFVDSTNVHVWPSICDLG